MVSGHPFMLACNGAHTLRDLRVLGFQTFAPLFNESRDENEQLPMISETSQSSAPFCGTQSIVAEVATIVRSDISQSPNPTPEKLWSSHFHLPASP